MVQTRARIGTHTQVNRVDEPQRVEPPHGRVDPAIDGDVWRVKRGSIADRVRVAWVNSLLSSTLRGAGLLGTERLGGGKEESCNYGCYWNERDEFRSSAHGHSL